MKRVAELKFYERPKYDDKLNVYLGDENENRAMFVTGYVNHRNQMVRIEQIHDWEVETVF